VTLTYAAVSEQYVNSSTTAPVFAIEQLRLAPHHFGRPSVRSGRRTSGLAHNTHGSARIGPTPPQIPSVSLLPQTRSKSDVAAAMDEVLADSVHSTVVDPAGYGSR
jgi:hypothetical protein